ncbi:MAG TPA: hypothetical protein VHG33_08920 [Woeseiaceae bacterium]|nr:hypothetical protein [Woeseiaceae bacterium]
MNTNMILGVATLAMSLLLTGSACAQEEPGDGPKGLVEIESAAPGDTAPAPGDASGVAPPALGQAGGAAQLETGRQYAAGTRVESPADGVSFVIPEEWLGGLPPGSAAFVFGSNSRAGLGLVIMRPATSWQEIEQFLNQPQDLGHGVVLYPSSAGQRTGRGYEISLANATYAGHAIGRLGRNGNGVVVFFGGPAGEHDYYARLTAGTAASVAFAPPRQSVATDQWRAYLAGMMLKRQSSYYSGGGADGSYVGGSTSESLHLCRDGTYAYLSSSSVAADAGGGTSGYSAGDGAERGQWSVETIGDRAVLNLRSTGGEASQHSLQVQGNETYVDGERVYRVQSDRCR